MQSPFKAQRMYLSEFIVPLLSVITWQDKNVWGARVTGYWHAFKLFIIISRISNAFFDPFFPPFGHSLLLQITLDSFVLGIVKGNREILLLGVQDPLLCSVRNGRPYSC